MSESEPRIGIEGDYDVYDPKTKAVWRANGSRKLMFDPLRVAPLLVYRAMKEKYGKPNGGFDEYKSQWRYEIRGSRSTITVYDSKLFSWLLIITPDSTVKQEERRRVVEQNWSEFLSWLKSACQKTKSSPDNYKHLFILNGYKQLRSNGDYFLKQCEKSTSEYRVENPMVWAAGVSYVLSAEALLNLMFELYLKDEVERDKDMVKRVMMFSMPEKWAFASSLCNCFTAPLRKSSKGYVALQRLVTLRNNMAHANISRDLKTYLLEEDEMEFVLPPDYQLYHEVMDPSSITLVDVEQIKHDVDVLAGSIIQAMKPRPRKEFPKLMDGNSVVIHRTRSPIRMSQWI